jgi:hypothetical protein
MKNNFEIDRQYFLNKYGPWALVTGGASGIGAEFCRQLAMIGLNIAIIDIQTKKMRSIKSALKKEYKISVIAINTDLTANDFMKKIISSASKIEIGLVINNAAFGSVGPFADTDPRDMEKTVMVNCRAPLLISRHFAPLLSKRGRGGMIFLSSTSALQGTPIVANYAATKAYNLVLGEALWNELGPSGCDVMVLAPGATNTPAFAASGGRIEKLPGMPFMQADEVVREALFCLGKRPLVIPGRKNRLIAFIMNRLLKRSAAVNLIGKNTRILYPHPAEKWTE